MKRTDLIALAERLAHAAEYVRSALPTLSEPDAKWLADQDAAVLLMRQIAESQPVAWRFEVRFCEPNPVSEWRHYNTTTSHEAALRSVSRCYGGIEGRAVPLYPLPLED